MIAAFAYSLSSVEEEVATIMLRPQVVSRCDSQDQAALFEADFYRLATTSRIVLDLIEVKMLTKDGLRLLRMFKRQVDLRGGSLMLRNVCDEIRPAMGKYFCIV